MRHFHPLTSMLLLCALMLTSCQNSTAPSTNTQQVDELTVYYFHGNRRCATCEAVEKVTKETMQQVFKDTIPFITINRDDSENRALVEAYRITGQTLLLVDKDTLINLTNTAFLNARTHPEQLKSDIEANIINLSK